MPTASAAVSARDARQEPPIGQLREELEQSPRARGSVAPLRLADEIRQRMPAVEKLEERGVRARHPKELIRLEVPEHPAPVALGGLQPLQRVAGPHPRVIPEAAWRRQAGLASGGGQDERLAGLHDDGPPRLRLAAPPLDDELMIAHPDPRAVMQLHRTIETLPI